MTQQVSEVVVRWTPETSGRARGIEIQARIAGTDQWDQKAKDFDPTVGEYRFTSNAPSTQLEVRARIWNTDNIPGDWFSVNILSAPAAGDGGAAGRDAYAFLSSNEVHQLPAQSDGTIIAYTGASTTLKVLCGSVDVTTAFTSSTAPNGNPQNLAVTGSYPTFSVTGGFDASEDVATFTFRLTGSGAHAGVVGDVTFSLSKSKAAVAGVSPPLITLTSDKDFAKYDQVGSYVGGPITFTAIRQNIPGTNTNFRIIRVSDGSVLSADTSDAFGAGYGGSYAGSGGDKLVMTAGAVASTIDAYGPFRVEAYRDEYTATDSVSIARVQDGANGATLTLIPITAQTRVSGSNVFTIPPDGGWGTGAAVSRESYNGGCSATFTLPANGGKNIMAGLSQTGFSGDAGYSAITFALHQNDQGATGAYINGGHIGPGPNIGTSSAIGKVDFDGRHVRWSINGAVFATYDWMGTIYDPNAPENKLYFRCALASSQPRLDDIVFVPRGSIGKNGVDGVPGARGSDGTTWYPYYAYANSPDGSVDFTTGEPGDRAYVGTSSGTSASEPQIPGLYSWSAYKGPSFGLATRGAISIAGDKIIRVSGGGWDADAYSTVGYRNGAAASFQFTPGATAMAGLNFDPTADASYSSLDYAWYARGDGICEIYESGGAITVHGGFDSSTKFMVQYDGRYIQYYKDGVLVRGPLDVGADKLFYFDSSLYAASGRITNIAFTPNGTRGAAGQSALVAGPSQATISLTGDTNGVPVEGELPRLISNGATVNGVAVAIDSISNVVTQSCAVTVMGSSVRIDSVSAVTASVSYKINASGQSASGSIAISTSKAPPPPASQSSATITVSNQSSFNNTPTQRGTTVTLTTGSSAPTLRASFGFDFRAPYSEAGTVFVTLYAQLYYRVAGGSWTPFGSEYSAISENEDGASSPGYVEAAEFTGPGLSPNTTYEFAVYFRRPGVRNALGITGNAYVKFA